MVELHATGDFSLIFALCVAVVGGIGAVKMWLEYRDDRRRLSARYRAAETADLEALRKAVALLDKAGSAIIREDLERGGHPSDDPKWTKVYHAAKAIESQLNDVISLAMGEKLK